MCDWCSSKFNHLSPTHVNRDWNLHNGCENPFICLRDNPFKFCCANVLNKSAWKRQTRCAMDSLARNERRHSEKWVEDKKIIIFFSRKACHGRDHDGNPSTTIIRVWLFPSRGRERETLPLIFHASIYNRVIIIEDKQSSLSHRELLFLFAARRISVKEASWQADYCASMRDAFCHAMSWNTPREISTIVFAAHFQRCLH